MARWHWVAVFSGLSVVELLMDRSFLGSLTGMVAALFAFYMTYLDSRQPKTTSEHSEQN